MYRFRQQSIITDAKLPLRIYLYISKPLIYKEIRSISMQEASDKTQN